MSFGLLGSLGSQFGRLGGNTQGVSLAEMPDGLAYYVDEDGAFLVDSHNRFLIGPFTTPPLPSGYVFYVDLDGAYLVNSDGNFLIGPV